MDGNVNTLDQNPASITSTVEPISVIGDKDFGKAPSLLPIAEEAEEEQSLYGDNGKLWGEQGAEAEKAGEAGGAHLRSPDTESNPIPPEIIEMEDLDANRDIESESLVCCH